MTENPYRLADAAVRSHHELAPLLITLERKRPFDRTGRSRVREANEVGRRRRRLRVSRTTNRSAFSAMRLIAGSRGSDKVTGPSQGIGSRLAKSWFLV
jgi:hypothetical protein